MSSSDVACVIAVSLQLLRMSVDLVQLASQQSSTTPAASIRQQQPSQNKSSTGGTTTSSQSGETDKLTLKKKANEASSKTYGSVDEPQMDNTESEPLLDEGNPTGNDHGTTSPGWLFFSRVRIFLAIWSTLTLVGLVVAIFGDHHALQASTLILLVIELLGLFLDKERILYGSFQRLVRLMSWIILWVTFMTLVLNNTGNESTPTTTTPILLWWSLGSVSVAVLVAVADGWLAAQHPTPARRASLSSTESASSSSPTLSRQAILQLIRPYFWPDATDETAFWNRVRAIVTWVCVICSKACNLVTPLLLGQASTALAHGEYATAIRMSIWYGIIKFLGNTFKEGQSLVYLKVAQAAFVQLAQASFQHLHQLSLDWHLRKKMGEVLRSMDRGISACDTLMKYLFLWLVPALTECLLVTIIFATYFQYFPLAVAVFYFVFAYVVWTILVTLWRKKFRKALVKHDNDYHDLFTDSMINFETVKYFTAEEFEKERFREAVARYQVGSVHVQGSLSFLNVSQQFILQACMATALSLAAWGIQKRISCCTETVGCETGISDCCRNVSNDVCPGMEVGDFVAVLTYISQLFQPLNFLGSVYNAVVMALIDLSNLSELLAESPDVNDATDAFALPETNATEPDVAVEFDNVHFHYPTQPQDRGLKGLSFKMKKGTTTAIVGPTGAGKTTVSRLLFRFYDVLGGAVKINGVDVRSVTQKSLRGSMGVVPQAASMFNDTIRFNLLYGRPEATEEELVKAAEDAQLLGFIESLDDGWETMVGDRGLKLSGGEKQRAAIARCLLKNPPFVLLDEATSALDTITENSVQEALDRLGEERTVLVIAHRLGTIRNADNIIVLKDGRVAEEGTHDDLLAKNGVYADMWNMQLHSASGSQTDLAGSIDHEHTNTVQEALEKFDKDVAKSPSKASPSKTQYHRHGGHSHGGGFHG